MFNSQPPLTLIIMSGVDDGKVLLLDTPRNGREYRIGREADNDIWLPFDGQISRHHATITAVDGRWMITDKNSKNGTYIAARRLEADAPVEADSLWRVGRTWLRIQNMSAIQAGQSHAAQSHAAQSQLVLSQAIQSQAIQSGQPVVESAMSELTVQANGLLGQEDSPMSDHADAHVRGC